MPFGWVKIDVGRQILILRLGYGEGVGQEWGKAIPVTDCGGGRFRGCVTRTSNAMGEPEVG
jgi:hypothetical protein